LSIDRVTWGDALGCMRAVAAFAAVLLAPGYCLAWACDLLGFRRRAAGERLAWCVVLSFGAVPLGAVMLGKYGSLLAVCWATGACAAGMAGLAGWEAWTRRAESKGLSRAGAIGAAAATAWALFVVAELVDVGVGSHLYMSVTVFDHALRTAFVNAVMRTGVPPANPLYWPGHAAPMRYYYFWYVVTAAAAKLAGATARQAMIASVVWAGFGLAAVLGLYCRNFLGGDSAEGRDIRRWPRIGLALALLAVTGLDVLPAIAKTIARLPTDADMEWWSPDQVASWMDSLLWVPHHVAGLVCCLLGFLLVWMAKGRSVGERVVCAVLAGLSFASAFGLSTWVALAFALVMLLWMGWVLVWEQASRARVPMLLGAGLVAALALLPYLTELRSEASGSSAAMAAQPGSAGAASGPAHLLRFGVRHMIDPDAMLGVPGFARLAHAHPGLEDAVAGLILLLPGYFLELGFYGIVLGFALREQSRRGERLDEAERTALALAVAGLLAATFLRSTVVVNNDFGIRSMLIAQFFLVLLAVRWCEGGLGEFRRWARRAAWAMLAIGVAGTVYQAVELRIYLPVQERLGRPEIAGLSQRAMALRTGLRVMDAKLPKRAVVQFNVEQPGEYFSYAEIMQTGRQMAVGLPDCPAAFGGEVSRCEEMEAGAAWLFSPWLTAQNARAGCDALGVSYLIATRWDAVWSNPSGWVWKLPAVVDTGDVRVNSCGGGESKSSAGFSQPGN